ESVSGAENVEFDADDGSISFSVSDGEGGQVDVSVEENGDIDAITGMGFNIPVPDGLVNGAVQRIDNDGEEMMINATFEANDLTTAEMYQRLHEAVTSQGFVYFDPTNSGRTQPDAESLQLIVTYQHPDGYQFTIMGDNTGVLLGLVRMENGATMDAMTETAVTTSLPTTLDGSMALDKESYKVEEMILVTLVINTPLANDAWVGIVPADTPHGFEADSDAVDVAYDYVTNAIDNQLTLYAPITPGAYDVRLFNTDASDGVELTSVTITVTE
ncbi:MAG: hypothetical protein KC443_05490, partial [Anaerolineales bacterium]|nr:hypothetical protein [Anaerolineales bacterium]